MSILMLMVMRWTSRGEGQIEAVTTHELFLCSGELAFAANVTGTRQSAATVDRFMTPMRVQMLEVFPFHEVTIAILCFWKHHRRSMINTKNTALLLLALLASNFLLGCRESKHDHHTGHSHQGHHHTPPHGGTPVVLGDEEYHIEFVLDAASGKLQAYVLDSHMENFIRLTNQGFQVSVQLNSKTELLSFRAMASSATGEKVGDTALFEAEAAWLKTTTNFAGTILNLTVRGHAFDNIQLHFPATHESAGGRK